MNKIKSLPFFILFLFIHHSSLNAQTEVTLNADEVSKPITPTLSEPISNFTPYEWDGKLRKNIGKTGYIPKKDWGGNSFDNPNALPTGVDPALQAKYNDESQRNHGAILDGWLGADANAVFSPGDPSIDVGPNYVIQMTNNSGGSAVTIWDKAGNVEVAEFLFETWTGVPGKGDPIVLYDQLAQRWVLTEFKPNSAGDLGMVIAVSQTSDPLGSYHIYDVDDFTGFPDYPKWGVWQDSYVMTSNESSQAVYVFDKNNMLAGNSAGWVRWSLSNFPTINFQAATPVDAQGSAVQAGQKPMFMRMADDAWSGAIANDRLEYFTIDIDWNNTAAASITGPTFINTDPFDTGICGYLTWECIPQPGTSIKLDPIRELLMNKIEYRDFGSYASIVCNHTVDVDNTDRAGIRWYELRKPAAGSWSIYQQGTYSPDVVHRWMAAITQNAYGEILLAYNVSDGTNVFPGLRFTGRESGDALGTMSIAETTMVNGTSHNWSNRYGDYNQAVVDPSDESFWFTGMYNTSTQWSSWVSHISTGGPPACSGSLVLNGVLDGDYISSGTIMTDGNVPVGNDVGLYAPGITTLGLGFSTALTGGLEIAFGDCSIFAPPNPNVVEENEMNQEQSDQEKSQNQ